MSSISSDPNFPQPARLITSLRGEHRLQLRVAGGFWARFRGLMLAPALRAQPQPQGLLLRRCTSVHGCFMRHAVDVVYVSEADESGAHRVTHTARLKPWRISIARSRLPAGPGRRQPLRCKHALELPAGSIQALGIARGDQLRLHP